MLFAGLIVNFSRGRIVAFSSSELSPESDRFDSKSSSEISELMFDSCSSEESVTYPEGFIDCC